MINPSFDVVLAAVDLSPISSAVVRVASSLAKIADARLVLLHVFQLPETSMPYRVDEGEFLRLVAQAREDARDAVSNLVKSAEAAVEAFEGYFPSRTICERARALRAGVIVLGSHGHGALREFVVGSTARDVLKDAPCPVLIVPAVSSRLGRPQRPGRQLSADQR